MKRLALLVFALIAIAASPLSRATETRRTNVLLVISDDLNNSLGGYGDPHAEHAATIAELTQQLRAAVKTTFPADGKTPEIQNEAALWVPTFIK